MVAAIAQEALRQRTARPTPMWRRSDTNTRGDGGCIARSLSGQQKKVLQGLPFLCSRSVVSPDLHQVRHWYPSHCPDRTRRARTFALAPRHIMA